MIREMLCNLLDCCKDERIDAPNDLENIDFDELYSVLSAEFPEAHILLADEKYKTTSKSEIERYLEEDVLDKLKYVSEYYDCDDFSFALKGKLSNPDWGKLPFGILWTETRSGAHALNCFVDKDREVWIIEPQTDEIFKLSSKPKWKPYLCMI
jgi:hypothetical protein